MNNFEQFLDIKKNRVFVLVAIMLVAFGMRLYQIDTRGPWDDEKLSIRHAIGATKTLYPLLDNPKESYQPNDFWIDNNLEGVTWGVTNISGGNALTST